MVGIVKDIVIPVKGGDPVFTIVCEVVTSPSPSQQDKDQPPTGLWKVRNLHYSPRHRSLEPAVNSSSEHNLLQTDASEGQMASAWRVISFFLVVFVLPTVLISLPLYARYHLYHARHLPMTETDTRALNHAVSSFWCQGQRVTSNGTLDAFLVAGSPRMRTSRRRVTLRRNLTLEHDDIEYWGVYLLEGSTFSLSSSARWPGGRMLVVRGQDNLRKCFYREERLESELNGDTVGTVFQAKEPDHEDNEQMPEEMTGDEDEDDRDGGGEVFDDDVEYKDVLNMKSSDGLNPHKYESISTVGETHKRSGKEKKKNRKGKKKNKHAKKDTHHGRSKRSSLLVERLRRNAPVVSETVSTASDGSVMEMLDILHKFNDTLDVTTGNSSISSSEEFLEQCRDAILSVDLTPYIDWENHLSVLEINSPDTWKFEANSSDYYYFIFTSDNSIELNYLGFNLELLRKTYDVSSPLNTCRNKTECIFPLAFTQEEAVVVEVPAPSGENLVELHSFEVTTTCQPRVPVYMVFILLVPFIILLFAFQ